MLQKVTKIWMAVLILISCVLLVWNEFGMNRELRIDAHSKLRLWSYDDRESGGKSVASVAKEGDEYILRCEFSRSYRWPFCGFNLGPGPEPITEGYDLSGYQTLELDLVASPKANAVRIFLRNYNPDYADSRDFRTLKVNELHFDPNKEVMPFVTELDKFQVAIWWVNEFSIPPALVERELTNVVNFGFGFSQNADEKLHELRFRSITFRGKWISRSSLQSIIIGTWIFSALVYLFVSFISTQRAIDAVKAEKEELEEINSALELERRELETLATRDSLTGVYNRFGLRGHLHSQSALVKQRKSDLSVIFIDLDNYKDINDDHGHAVGDEVLKSFAGLVEANTRAQDVFCRWGGDEFLLMCDNTALSEAVAIAEKLRTVISEYPWPPGVKVTCSFGVAEMDPDESIGSFIRRADVSLYKAKEAGRNKVVADLEEKRDSSIKLG